MQKRKIKMKKNIYKRRGRLLTYLLFKYDENLILFASVSICCFEKRCYEIIVIIIIIINSTKSFNMFYVLKYNLYIRININQVT